MNTELQNAIKENKDNFERVFHRASWFGELGLLTILKKNISNLYLDFHKEKEILDYINPKKAQILEDVKFMLNRLSLRSGLTISDLIKELNSEGYFNNFCFSTQFDYSELQYIDEVKKYCLSYYDIDLEKKIQTKDISSIGFSHLPYYVNFFKDEYDYSYDSILDFDGMTVEEDEDVDANGECFLYKITPSILYNFPEIVDYISGTRYNHNTRLSPRYHDTNIDLDTFTQAINLQSEIIKIIENKHVLAIYRHDNGGYTFEFPNPHELEKYRFKYLPENDKANATEPVKFQVVYEVILEQYSHYLDDYPISVITIKKEQKKDIAKIISAMALTDEEELKKQKIKVLINIGNFKVNPKVFLEYHL